ncbi:MAG: hypothetical protein JWO67_4860 [Streptosporangiaceae bacterium]|nr:hypothetical protein [Streptosporangiaceae bacterium]
MPAAKGKYTVIRSFDRTDPSSGKDTHYGIGAAYDGPDPEKYLEWPDGGALIALAESVVAPAAVDSAPAADSTSDGGKK